VVKKCKKICFVSAAQLLLQLDPSKGFLRLPLGTPTKHSKP